MNINNFGPKSAMGANMKSAIDNAKKVGEKNGIEDLEKATDGNRPQGNTDVNNTVIINNTDDGYTVKYDGVDDGIVIELVDGQFDRIYKDDGHHNFYRDQGEGFHPNEE